MLGMSMARNTRSGTLVGPGIWRKCLPVCTVIWHLSRYCLGFARLEYHYSEGLSPQRSTFIRLESHIIAWQYRPMRLAAALNDGLKCRLAARAPERPLCLDVSGRNTAGFLMKMASEITSARVGPGEALSAGRF